MGIGLIENREFGLETGFEPGPNFTDLAHELILGLKWHPYHAQQYTHVDLATVATKPCTFTPKRGLVWQKMVSLG